MGSEVDTDVHKKQSSLPPPAPVGLQQQTAESICVALEATKNKKQRKHIRKGERKQQRLKNDSSSASSSKRIETAPDPHTDKDLTQPKLESIDKDEMVVQNKPKEQPLQNAVQKMYEIARRHNLTTPLVVTNGSINTWLVEIEMANADGVKFKAVGEGGAKKVAKEAAAQSLLEKLPGAYFEKKRPARKRTSVDARIVDQPLSSTEHFRGPPAKKQKVRHDKQERPKVYESPTPVPPPVMVGSWHDPITTIPSTSTYSPPAAPGAPSMNVVDLYSLPFRQYGLQLALRDNKGRERNFRESMHIIVRKHNFTKPVIVANGAENNWFAELMMEGKGLKFTAVGKGENKKSAIEAAARQLLETLPQEYLYV